MSRQVELIESPKLLKFVKDNHDKENVIASYIDEYIIDDGGYNACYNAVELGIKLSRYAKDYGDEYNIYYCIYKGSGYYVVSNNEENVLKALKNKFIKNDYSFVE